jgi:MFS superfamily sulfate permease-like transporter
VLTGFVFGLAMVIAIKQVPKLFGLESGEGNFFERLWDIIFNLPETHMVTLVVGLTSLALMFFLEKRYEKIPAALVVLIYGIAIGTIIDPEANGVHISRTGGAKC